MRQITSLQHPLVKHLVKLRQNRDYREEHHSLVVEGVKLIHELSQHRPFKLLVVWDETLVPHHVQADQIVLVTPSIMQKISGLLAPEGLLAEIAMPQPASLQGLKRLIALDGINDPGNVGTLLRTALALGWQGAFFLDTSCDPFNDKALRAARGATFHLPLAWGNGHDLEVLIKTNRLQPLLADPKGADLATFVPQEVVMLVLGNEAHGATEHVRQLCTAVRIAMPAKMESLNVAVAGGIMMYELRRS